MKRLLLQLLRVTGLFRLCLFLTRRRLRILCYHGISSGDEHLYSPFLFMRPAVFRRRMDLLARRGVPVIPLDEGIRRLKVDGVRRAETVITFDDGWRSNLTLALPVLRQHDFPACVYVTTDHLDDGNPVTNVVLWYLLWKTSRSTLNLSGVHPSIDGHYPLGERRNDTGLRLMTIAATLERRQQRELLETLATELQVNDTTILDSDRFRLMSVAELLEMQAAGVDVQLHTHSHHLPADSFANMSAEVSENRQIVERIIGIPRRHFCYPSGHYGRDHPAWLAQLGIESATTCNPGHCSSQANPLLLPRHLDRDDASDVIFDAEICGVLEIGRALRRLLRRQSAPQTTVGR
jgi:peptidoglycan/xylan/chitin deacetylase (PgdA/CDA1 family)